METAPTVFYSEKDERLACADTCTPVKGAVASGAIELHGLGRRDYPGTPMADAFLPELGCVGYWNVRKKQAWGLPWHMNEGIEICLLDKGALTFEVEDEAFELSSGAVTVTRPWQRHRLGVPQVTPSILFWLILDVGVRRPHDTWQWPSWVALAQSDLDELSQTLHHNATPVVTASPAFVDCCRRFMEVVTQGTPSESRVRVYLNDLLLELLDLLRGRDLPLDQSLASTQHTVRLFLERLPDSLGAAWDVGSMAAACDLGRTQFCDNVRELTNQSPMKYLNRRRLEKAAEALKQRPKATIAEIAGECGFGSAEYFARQFGKHFGKSPTAWRAG